MEWQVIQLGIEVLLDDVTWRVVDGELVLLDLRNSKYLTFNRTGTELWLALVDGVPSERLEDHLVDKYEIDPAEAHRDVQEFVAELRTRGLAT